MAVPGAMSINYSIKQVFFKAVSKRHLHMIILNKLKVAILKRVYNMASSNMNLILKVTGSMNLPSFSLALTSILLSAHNNEKQFICL